MDMAMALEWVYNNVRFFNGDRDRITVFGPGAGGAAAGLLAVLPKTKDWVRQVIAQVSVCLLNLVDSACYLGLLLDNLSR